jgi:hypothetical protein
MKLRNGKTLLFWMVQVKDEIAIALGNNWVIFTQSFLKFGLTIILVEVGDQEIGFFTLEAGKNLIKILDIRRKRPDVGVLPAIVG